MRRPLKPFVTEYKSSNRRAPAQGDAAVEEGRQDLFDAAPKAGPDDSYEAALRAADALFRPSASADPPAPASNGEGERSPSPEQGGRILRVIDEAPLPQFAALEAEHAPKRRGRKPGSKNKPKVPGVLASRPPSARGAPSRATPPARPVHALPEAALRASPVAGAPIGGATRYVRFSWIRDRLKPGEEWKRRRLPKICW